MRLVALDVTAIKHVLFGGTVKSLGVLLGG